MTQQEFDQLPGVIVHILTEDRQHALCSGLPIDTNGGVAYPPAYKMCQACYYAAMRMQPRIGRGPQ